MRNVGKKAEIRRKAEMGNQLRKILKNKEKTGNGETGKRTILETQKYFG